MTDRSRPTKAERMKKHRKTWMLPYATTGGTVLVSVVVYLLAMRCAPGICEAHHSGLGALSAVGYAEYAARVNWAVLFVAYTVLGITVSVFALTVISESVGKGPAEASGFWKPTSAVIALVGTVSIAAYSSFGPPMLLGEVFGLEEPPMRLGYPALQLGVYDSAPVDRLLDAGNILAVVSMILTTVAVAAVLWERGQYGIDEQAQTSSGTPKKPQRPLEVLLFIAAALLVAGTLESAALHSWAAAGVEPVGGYSMEGANLGDTVPNAVGFFFTLILAGIFVPARLVLGQSTGERSPSWNIGVVRQALEGLAVLAPALVNGLLN